MTYWGNREQASPVELNADFVSSYRSFLNDAGGMAIGLHNFCNTMPLITPRYTSRRVINSEGLGKVDDYFIVALCL